MSRIYLLFSCGIIGLSIGLIYLWLNNLHGRTSVSVKDTRNTYTISAIYPQNQTEKIKLSEQLFKTRFHFQKFK
jgi:hypothetical protein